MYKRVSLILLLIIFGLKNAFTFINGQPASDCLGQLDDSLNPVYTKRNQDGGPNNIGFLNPQKVAVDTVHHRLFVADTDNHRVLIFNLDENNNLIDRVADNVLGQSNFTSNTHATTQSGMYYPTGVAYDSVNDRLFVADKSNHRVLVFDVSTITNGENAIHVLGQSDFTSNTHATTQSGMYYPTDVVYDSTNNRLFVADWGNNRVLVFDVSTITNGENAIYVLGQSNFTSRFPATTQSGMDGPIGLAYDTTNNRLFVADQDNNRVLVFDVSTITNGENAIHVLGQSDFTSNTYATTQSGMYKPTGVAYDSANDRLFVADKDNHRVLVFDVDISTITDGENATNVLGQPNFTSWGYGVTQSAMYEPTGLACDSINSRLFVVDSKNNRVLLFDVSTTTITNGENASDCLGQLDDSLNPFYTKDKKYGGPNKIGFCYPEGIAIDTVHHRLFVSDRDNNRVLVFNLDENNNLIDRVADNVLGQPTFSSYTWATTQSRMREPMGLAYDSINDRLFVADRGNNRVLVFDVSTITNGEDAINVLGQPDFTSNASATTQSGMYVPTDVAYDSTNNRLFVADSENNRVLVFDVSTITNGEDAINVLGQPDFTSYYESITSSGMGGPYGLEYDSTTNRLFVADRGGNRVLVFDVSTITNGEDAINVLGQPDFTSYAYATTQSGMWEPTDVAYDSTNNCLFVADHTNHRVLVFDVSTITNGENAINVLGQPDFTHGWYYPITQSSMHGPECITYDSTNNRLFVVDWGNHRILIFNDSKPAISLSTKSLKFTATYGSNPQSQTFDITNTGDEGSTLNWTATVDTTWLTLSPSSGTLAKDASETVTVSVNISGLSPGTYNATITVLDPSASNSPQTIHVTLAISAPIILPIISLSTTSLRFEATYGSGNPRSQTFTITNTGDEGSTLNWTATVDATWLTLSPSSGTLAKGASETVTVSVDITGLSTGTYNATITVLDPNASNSPQTIHVTLTIMSLTLRVGDIKIIGSTEGKGTINPDRGDKAHIRFRGAQAGKFVCKIFTLAGELVYEETKDGMSEGYFEWIPRDIASGTYIVYVEGPGVKIHKKIVILR